MFNNANQNLCRGVGGLRPGNWTVKEKISDLLSDLLPTVPIMLTIQVVQLCSWIKCHLPQKFNCRAVSTARIPTKGVMDEVSLLFNKMKDF